MLPQWSFYNADPVNHTPTKLSVNLIAQRKRFHNPYMALEVHHKRPCSNICRHCTSILILLVLTLSTYLWFNLVWILPEVDPETRI